MWFSHLVTLGLAKFRARQSRPQPDPHSSVTTRVLSTDAGRVTEHEPRVRSGLKVKTGLASGGIDPGPGRNHSRLPLTVSW